MAQPDSTGPGSGPTARHQSAGALKQWRLYSWKTVLQKQRAFGQTLCELLAPVVIVALFAWLYLLVDKSVVPDATFECNELVLENAKYDFVYLPRALNETGTRLALVGDGALRAGFRAHLAATYPGISAGAVAQLECSLFAFDGQLNAAANASSAFVPPFGDALLLDFETEGDLEAYIADGGYGQDADKPPVYAAVVFQGCGGCAAAGGSDPAPQWRYRVRVNASNIPDTHTATDPLQRGVALSNLQHYVMGNTSQWSTGAPHPLENRMPGFVAIQLAVDRFILNSTGGDTASLALADAAVFAATWNCSNTEDAGSAGALAELALFTQSHALLPQRVRVAAFPVASFSSDSFYSFVQSVFALVFVMSFFFPSFFLIRGLVVEKETRVREGIRMMGMSDLPLYAAWYTVYGAIFLVIALCVTITCAVTMFSRSDGGILFLFFWLFGLSSMALCFALSTLFSKARLASIVGAVLFIATFFPYFSVNDPLKPAIVKSAASLCSPVAFGIALDILATLESNGVGLTWGSISTVIGNASFANCLVMMAVDIVLYSVLGWYLNLVFPQEFGQQLPWYFFATADYWFPQRATAPAKARGGDGAAEGLLGDGGADGGGGGWEPALGADIEAPGQALNVLGRAGRCVAVRGLRKEFSTPDGTKVAVDGVDLDIFEGQIFVLLGHNGAGKSTTISMLTGVVQPSGGSCTMFGRDIAHDMTALRRDVGLGVCPQQNVLWDDLTVEEHLLFFAGLKGLSSSAAEAAMRSVVREVGLTEKVRTASKDLSGGMKRKLSVAIALVGDSKVVFLDEPTSGMDPYSRRSTWQILQNARKGRVMVLTTHFMDEADLREWRDLGPRDAGVFSALDRPSSI
jgi:ABC-type branched-subunit amino acid transport system ATPase component